VQPIPRYLNSTAIEAPITGLAYFLPDITPKDGLFVVDTAEMFAALEGEGTANKRSLQFICKVLDIPHTFMHNAGNDAHVSGDLCASSSGIADRRLQCTLLAMITMASGDPLDIQREKRWPARTGEGKSTKVQFTPWEEDEMSDVECVMPAVSGYDPKTGDLIGADAMDERED
jgi:hypothetical protein